MPLLLIWNFPPTTTLPIAFRFTLGFPLWRICSPNNATCGITHAVSTAAVGVVGTNEITVVELCGIEVEMEVSIPGVDPTARLPQLLAMQ